MFLLCVSYGYNIIKIFLKSKYKYIECRYNKNLKFFKGGKSGDFAKGINWKIGTNIYNHDKINRSFKRIS